MRVVVCENILRRHFHLSLFVTSTSLVRILAANLRRDTNQTWHKLWIRSSNVRCDRGGQFHLCDSHVTFLLRFKEEQGLRIEEGFPPNTFALENLAHAQKNEKTSGIYQQCQRFTQHHHQQKNQHCNLHLLQHRSFVFEDSPTELEVDIVPG